MVVVRAAALVHPQLDQAPLHWRPVHCMQRSQSALLCTGMAGQTRGMHMSIAPRVRVRDMCMQGKDWRSEASVWAVSVILTRPGVTGHQSKVGDAVLITQLVLDVGILLHDLLCQEAVLWVGQSLHAVNLQDGHTW